MARPLISVFLVDFKVSGDTINRTDIGWFFSCLLSWRDGRAVECDGLENRYLVKRGIRGSNPLLSSRNCRSGVHLGPAFHADDLGYGFLGVVKCFSLVGSE